MYISSCNDDAQIVLYLRSLDICLFKAHQASCMMYSPITRKTNACSLQFMFGMCVCGWFLMFLVSRLHILHHAYTQEVQMRDDESWLVQQCGTDEFYHNMKQHSALCDEVQNKKKSILILNALQHMVANTYLCGYEPCGNLLTAMLDWCMTRGMVITAFIAVMILILPTVFLPLFRSYLNSMADQRISQLYHTPYGLDNYARNQISQSGHVYRLE